MKDDPEAPIKVLDTYALAAFFQNEPGGVRVENLLKAAADASLRLMLSVVNLGELYYIVYRKRGQAEAENLLSLVFVLPVEIISADWELTYRAAQIKAQASLSYADCFAAALAQQNGCPVVTGDPEFQRIEAIVSVEWCVDRQQV